LKQREKFSQRVEATKPHGGESGLLNSSWFGKKIHIFNNIIFYINRFSLLNLLNY
jgi:hypothetical protein